MKFSQMKTRLLRDHHHQFCQRVGGRLKEFFDAGHLAAIQTSVTSKALPKITFPLQIPECHANPRLSLTADTHDENEDFYDHVFKILLAEVKTEDIHTNLCSAMLATAVVVASYTSRMLLHETMETINEVPNHLEKGVPKTIPQVACIEEIGYWLQFHYRKRSPLPRWSELAG